MPGTRRIRLPALQVPQHGGGCPVADTGECPSAEEDARLLALQVPQARRNTPLPGRRMVFPLMRDDVLLAR